MAITNDTIISSNKQILDIFPGELFEYKSRDECLD